MTRDPQIIPLGGLTGDPAEVFLYRYLLEQTGVAHPSVAYIGTASGDSDAGVARFYELFTPLDCNPCHLPLFRRTPDLPAFLDRQDLILVGGGNTRSMLAVWQDWGLPALLDAAHLRGAVLAGWSAGAICWFEEGVTDSLASELGPLPGLGLLPGSCCPHYDGEVLRRPAYHDLIAAQRIAAGLAIDDGVAVHFRDGEPIRVVSARSDANAYRVTGSAQGVRETVLDVERIDLDPPSLLIRRFEPGDQPAVWALHTLALDEAGLHAGHGPWDADLRDPWASYVDSGGAFLVGVLEGRIVAMGALVPTSPESAEIVRMRVDPRLHRRGYGARILEELETLARDRGLQRLHLDTTVDQTAAQRLYTGHGYREVRRGRIGPYPAIFYEKNLAGPRSPSP